MLYPFKHLFIKNEKEIARDLLNYRYELFQNRQGTVIGYRSSDYDLDLLSDLFQEEVRLSGRRVTSLMSPMEAFLTEPDWVESKLQEIEGEYTHEKFREILWKDRTYQECSNFFPTKVIGLLKRFFPNVKSILDPTAGYGDRLIGAMASQVERYVGVDCNPALFPGYEDIIRLMEEAGSKTDAEMINSPFEEFETDEKFDLILTSPPFHNYEIYSGGRQSTITHRTKRDWVEVWFRGFVEKCREMLNDGGLVVLYIEKVGDIEHLFNRFEWKKSKIQFQTGRKIRHFSVYKKLH